MEHKFNPFRLSFFFFYDASDIWLRIRTRISSNASLRPKVPIENDPNWPTFAASFVSSFEAVALDSLRVLGWGKRLDGMSRSEDGLSEFLF